MAKVIVCFGAVGLVVNPGPDPRGQYLKMYDPEAFDGRGSCDWTPDPELAIKFANTTDAVATIMTAPVARPVRADGAPNRPLRAYSLSIQEVPYSGMEVNLPGVPMKLDPTGKESA